MRREHRDGGVAGSVYRRRLPLPAYAQNLLPRNVISRPLHGTPPAIDLVLGYNEANPSPLLKFLLAKADELKSRVMKEG